MRILAKRVIRQFICLLRIYDRRCGYIYVMLVLCRSSFPFFLLIRAIYIPSIKSSQYRTIAFTTFRPLIASNSHTSTVDRLL